LTPGLAKAWRLNRCRELDILDFLQTASSDFQLLSGRLLGLLHELMEDYDPVADHRAIEDASDALGGFETKLEQSVSHGPSVRHAEIGTVYLHALSVPNKAGDETGG
jgi:hypothetical protein